MYCSNCYGLDDAMSDCDYCFGTGKEPICIICGQAAYIDEFTKLCKSCNDYKIDLENDNWDYIK